MELWNVECGSVEVRCDGKRCEEEEVGGSGYVVVRGGGGMDSGEMDGVGEGILGGGGCIAVVLMLMLY